MSSVRVNSFLTPEISVGYPAVLLLLLLLLLSSSPSSSLSSSSSPPFQISHLFIEIH
jgi:hypothetical protein